MLSRPILRPSARSPVTKQRYKRFAIDDDISSNIPAIKTGMSSLTVVRYWPGSNPEPRLDGQYRAWVDTANQMNVPIVALDIPSGFQR
jgi:NAD(P)H-hydrate repair Nnr-like enzyme with NAD(P)H-hydrate epimerase domain